MQKLMLYSKSDRFLHPHDITDSRTFATIPANPPQTILRVISDVDIFFLSPSLFGFSSVIFDVATITVIQHLH